jgi:hypothetical protein
MTWRGVQLAREALADVLGQLVVRGRAAPPQRGALEAVRGYLASALDTEVAGRVTAATEYAYQPAPASGSARSTEMPGTAR